METYKWYWIGKHADNQIFYLNLHIVSSVFIIVLRTISIWTLSLNPSKCILFLLFYLYIAMNGPHHNAQPIMHTMKTLSNIKLKPMYNKAYVVRNRNAQCNWSAFTTFTRAWQMIFNFLSSAYRVCNPCAYTYFSDNVSFLIQMTVRCTMRLLCNSAKVNKQFEIKCYLLPHILRNT